MKKNNSEKMTIDIKTILNNIEIKEDIVEEMLQECLMMWYKSNSDFLIECAKIIESQLNDEEYKNILFEIIKEASSLSGLIIIVDKKIDLFQEIDFFIKTYNNKEKNMLKKEIVSRAINGNKSIIKLSKMPMAVINIRKDFYYSI